MNTWPGGHKHGMCQSEHEEWNRIHYPGTRQLCELCGIETGRCEDDARRHGDIEPLCAECWQELESKEGKT